MRVQQLMKRKAGVISQRIKEAFIVLLFSDITAIMFILSSIFNCFASLCGCGRNGSASEQSPLLQERSVPFVQVTGANRYGFASSEFIDFAHSKAMVILCLSNLVIFLVVGVVAYSFIFENWSIIDSLYFSCVTFTTVGYGDLTPSNDRTRLFTIFFALYGVIILGLFIGLIGETIVERHNAALEAFRARARQRTVRMFGVSPKGETVSPEAAIMKPREEPTVTKMLCDILLLEGPIVVIIMLMALMLGHYEGWSIIGSLYFGVVTSSTIGFGDMTPDTDSVRIVAMFFIPVCVAVFCEILGRIAGAYLELRTIRKEKEFLSRQLTFSDLEHMDTNKNGVVEWGEFLSFMLVAMQKVDKEDIAELRELFEKVDIDSNDFLDKRDLMQRAKSSMRML